MTSAKEMRGYGLVAMAACSWGLWPLLLRRAEAYGPVSASLESAIVMVMMLVVGLPLALRQRARTHVTHARTGERANVPARTFGAWLAMALLGVSDALNTLFFFAAYGKTSVAIAVLTHYLTPIFVALAAPIVLRERATLRTAFATACAFGGLALLLEPWRVGGRPNDLLGAALGAGSAVFYASNVLVQKRWAGVFSSSEFMGYHALVAAPLLLLTVPRQTFATVDARAVAILVLSALGPGALACLAFVAGLSRIPASHASTLTLLEPLVAVLVGVFVFGESLGPLGIVGGAAILAGAFLVVTGSAPPPPSSTPPRRRAPDQWTLLGNR